MSIETTKEDPTGKLLLPEGWTVTKSDKDGVYHIYFDEGDFDPEGHFLKIDKNSDNIYCETLYYLLEDMNAFSTNNPKL